MKINLKEIGEYLCAFCIGFVSMAIADKVRTDDFKYVLAGVMVIVGLYFLFKLNHIEEKIK
jgi:hypothetical protein